MLALLTLASQIVVYVAAAGPAPDGSLSGRERVLHALNRLGYGPRPGEVEKIEALGVDAWVERQLNPERIPDADVEARLRAAPLLQMSGAELMTAYPQAKKNVDGMGLGKPGEVARELAAARILRGVYSERQFDAVLTDFWFNHFNISAEKAADRWLVVPYERDVIRPHMYGKFRDLLGAVAHSPAMLVYLDNAQSSIDARYAPLSERPRIDAMEEKMAARGKGPRRLGLNENYAREMLELHTLGVDGGYTQKDVTELARILTGWTIARPNPRNGLTDVAFHFDARRHDPGVKVFLGQTYVGAGQTEGERALDRLSRNPSTARFIATKLCRRFVADDPPPALVARVARRFRETDGDLRETYRALFTDAEFWNKSHFRAKVRTPLEFVLASLRATGAEIRDPSGAPEPRAPPPAPGILNQLGMPLYRCEPPTGWPDRAEPWVNAGALLARLRYAQGLFADRANSPAVADPAAPLGNTPREDGRALLAAYEKAYLGGVVSDRTREALERRLDDPEISRARLDDRARDYRVERLAALVLGAPDFERR
jgi:uncharacterized protein (DUF1800 family)